MALLFTRRTCTRPLSSLRHAMVPLLVYSALTCRSLQPMRSRLPSCVSVGVETQAACRFCFHMRGPSLIDLTGDRRRQERRQKESRRLHGIAALRLEANSGGIGTIEASRDKILLRSKLMHASRRYG